MREEAFYKACEWITSLTPDKFGEILRGYKMKKCENCDEPIGEEYIEIVEGIYLCCDACRIEYAEPFTNRRYK